MLEVEDFIGVQKWYTQDNFVINPDTGYYCIKAKAEDAALQCLASSKVKRDKKQKFYANFREDKRTSSIKLQLTSWWSFLSRSTTT